MLSLMKVVLLDLLFWLPLMQIWEHILLDSPTLPVRWFTLDMKADFFVALFLMCRTVFKLLLNLHLGVFVH
jgi:hypothetical protein